MRPEPAPRLGGGAGGALSPLRGMLVREALEEVRVMDAVFECVLRGGGGGMGLFSLDARVGGVSVTGGVSTAGEG